MGETLYCVKWHNFKMAMYVQGTSLDASLKLATPHIVNLTTDRKELEAIDLPHIQSWTAVNSGKS